MNIVVVDRPSDAEILNIVSVDELKKNVRKMSTVENDIAQRCILAAYDWLAGAEHGGWLNRTLITTTYKAVLPGFYAEQTYSSRETGGPAVRLVPTSSICLPVPPLVSVESIKYLVAGAQQTLDTPDYVVSKTGLFGKVVKSSGVTWPTNVDTHPEALEIAFTAGYGTGAQVKAKCPGIVQALTLLASDAFENREDTYAEPRLVAVDRKIIWGVTRYAGRYRIPNRYA